ncbi:MAG: DNA polymerase III subunit gamma/tau [Prevotellaceae bacterium]|jgi:DNA polymerase-3 subunit gamma/tau|nr:DNA polymerase III subunit gamma/tau [Prevotellaceae bacterium]
MEQFIVSARKYRPVTFESVVGQDAIATTLKNAIRRKQLAHAYLFCGPRGVGKTTCARIFAKTINCLQPAADLEACGVCESCQSFAEGRSYSIHELDAASNNSVDDIRTLTDQVRVPPQVGKYSVYIIDEVHMLSSAAFNAFLKTLEEPPAHAIFILATTEKHKIIPTILSRCQIYDFNRISIDHMVGYLKNIAQKEAIAVEDAALNIIAQKADGAMRDALSLFDQAVVFCGDNITYDAIIKNLHVVDYKYYFSLTGYLLEHRYTDALLLFDEVLSKGFDALHFIAGLSEHFRNLLVCKDAATLRLFESGEAFKKDYLEQTAQCPAAFLFEALAIANACEMGYKSSGHPRLHVELALLRLSNAGAEKKNDEPVAAPEETPQKKTPEDKPAEIKNNEPDAGAKTHISLPSTPAAVPPAPPAPISIKLPPDNKTGKEEKNETVLRHEDFSQEQLLAAWEKLIAHKKETYPRLAAALDLDIAKPALQENHRITCFTANAQQKDWMETNIKPEIIAFLNAELQNDDITLELLIIPHDQQENLLYTNDQKFNYLRSNYPVVEQLKQALHLES